MPREFYADLNRSPLGSEEESLCGHETTMWDGLNTCNRSKDHPVDVMTSDNDQTGEFHQEAFEGWIWDNEGAIG